MAEGGSPLRLKRHRQTSPTLVQVLLLLQRGRDDTARLARVAAGLGPVLDMPLEAASRIVRRSTASASRPRQRVMPTWFTCVAGGLAVLAPFLWLTDQVRSPLATNVISARASESPLPVTRASAHSTLQVASTPDADPSAARAAAVRDPAPSVTSARGFRRGPRSKRVALQRLAASTRLPAFETSRSVTEALDMAPLAEPIVVAARPAAATETATIVAGAQPQAAAAAPPSRATEAVSSSESESELLLRARGAMRADLERALRLVAEHEARFSKGELVPEREVLAIEVLRALGQNAAADVRTQQFRTRYPESFYLERLRR